MILKNANVEFQIGGAGTYHNLSEYVRQVNLDTGAENVDDTTMGKGTRSNEVGLDTWGVSITFKQEFGADKVDDILWRIKSEKDKPTKIRIRSNRGAGISASNPQWEGPCYLTTYSPVGGAVGVLHEGPVSVVPAGDLIRSVA